MKNGNRLFVYCLLCTLSSFAPYGNAAAPQRYQSDTIPLDPTVRYGKLKNGFTYYIGKSKSHREIEMRLVIKAGSSHEDDEQLGIAHLLEHVACRGTVHFPKGIPDYIESKGLQVGNNMNAVTDATHTLYYVRFASGKPELLASGLQMLRDWAHGLLLDSMEIDAERGSVFQEFATRLSSESEKIRSYILNHPEHYYSEKREYMLENIKKFKHKSLVRFYNDWYRPDLQAAIIVGNVDVDKIEAQIKSLFSDLDNPQNSKNNAEISPKEVVSLTGKNQFVKILDSERSNTQVQIFMKKRAAGVFDKSVTVKDYRNHVVDELLNEIMTARWMNYNESNLFVHKIRFFISRGIFRSHVDVFQTQIELKSLQSLQSAVIISMKGIEQIRRFGFTESELAAAKENFLKDYNARDGLNLHKSISDFTDHFVLGTAAPGYEYEKQLVNSLTTKISLEEINEAIRAWINIDQNMDIIISASEDEKDALPGEAEVLDWIQGAKSSKLAPYQDTVRSEIITLISPDKLKELQVSNAYKSLMVKEIGISKLALQNGIQVILRPFKPVGHQKNVVLLHGFSSGGALLYSNEDYPSAHYSVNIVKNGGVGELNGHQVRRYLKSKDMEVFPYIDDREEGIRGSSNSKDLEEMLQLVYLYFTAPRKDQHAYKEWMLRANNRKINDQNRFYEIIRTSTRCEGQLPSKSINLVQMDKAYEIYKERFGNAADFTFIITGDFEEDQIRPIILKYLGNLPHTGRKEFAKKELECKPQGILRKVIEGRGTEATVQLIFSGDYHFNERNNIQLDVLANALGVILTDRLRSKEGGVYGITVNVHYSMRSKGYYEFKLNFQCDPNGKDRMIDAVLEEINNLRLNGLSKETFQKAKEKEKHKFHDNLARNSFWQKYLEEQFKHRQDPLVILARESLIDDIEKNALKEVAVKYLNVTEYKLFVLL